MPTERGDLDRKYLDRSSARNSASNTASSARSSASLPFLPPPALDPHHTLVHLVPIASTGTVQKYLSFALCSCSPIRELPIECWLPRWTMAHCALFPDPIIQAQDSPSLQQGMMQNRLPCYPLFPLHTDSYVGIAKLFELILFLRITSLPHHRPPPHIITDC